MEASAVQELKVTARLVYDGKEVQTLEKLFGIQNAEQETESQTKSIDETITDFLHEIQKTANENGYTISKELINNAAVALIFYIIRQSEPTLTLDLELTKEVEKKEIGDSKNSNS